MLLDEATAIRMFKEKFPGFDYVNTRKDEAIVIDGFISSEGVLKSGVEVKTRPSLTVNQLKHEYNNRWLISMSKIDDCVDICKKLGVDFRGFLYLVPDKVLMIVPIWSYDRGFVADMFTATTMTQETCNGGLVMRLNAFIDITHATCVADLS